MIEIRWQLMLISREITTEFSLSPLAFFIAPTASGRGNRRHNPGYPRLDPPQFIEIGQIATRRPLSSSRPGALRIRAIVFDMDWKTKESDGEKENQTNQPDPPGGNVAREQSDQTRKQNRLRKWYTGTSPDRVGGLR
jgi:hypothetical protein